jgi:hypothetical protein
MQKTGKFADQLFKPTGLGHGFLASPGRAGNFWEDITGKLHLLVINS